MHVFSMGISLQPLTTWFRHWALGINGRHDILLWPAELTVEHVIHFVLSCFVYRSSESLCGYLVA